jgi:flagellar hook-associated protein 2
MPLINFAGLASGIDSEGLIEATAKVQRQVRIEPKETKITEYEETNSALSELKTKLTELQSILRNFTSLSGGIIAKQASSTDESILTAAASKNAQAGSYSLTVSQIAKTGTGSLSSSSQTYSTSSAVINSSINNGAAVADRRVRVEVGLGSEKETVDIELTNTTTLDQFVTQYNSTATKSVATVINVGTTASPDYQIMIASNNQGTEQGTLAFTVGSEVTTAGSGAFNDNTIDQATNAQFTMNGVGGTITRTSNTVSDLITGVTFNISATGTATVNIGNDTTTSTSSINEFVEKYNEIVVFINENNTITREEDGEDSKNIFAALAKTRVDDNSLTSLRSAISNTSVTSTTVTIFAAMGIVTERDGTLKIKEDELETALNTEPNAVNNLFKSFSDTTSLTGGTIDNFIRFNGLIDVSINGNKTQITNLNDQITRSEQIISAMEAQLRARFARLEGLIGNLQNQQQSLSSILGAG